ncbi:helicase [Nocardia sp. SYP-A9097]|uniref:DISARM system SNF2-like helicase DrmD n=1 Tax=Nocardia sp. SYP-A9097 TaxID=2663237 RepID=UPI00132AE52E|nr:DISARM system SNF2-like helicase DrmD [Nocardia sp. SYP-A9097]MRH92818.1 helicase [Nocardia sp. SYP-A9097]
MASAVEAGVEQGKLVQVRGERWVVSDVDAQGTSTLVTLQSVEGDRFDETLQVIWEIEHDPMVLPSGSLPEIRAGGFDQPVTLQAFLDAIRWSAVTSADVKTLQAPFRSGVAIEDYQLEPVARALDAPRVNLLLADDVGLGKTIEAGLVAQELLLRQRAKRIMIVCPAGLTTKWKAEMDEKFGLDFTIIDSDKCAEVRRTHGSAANPFEVFGQSIISLPWLRGAKAQRLLDEVLPGDGPTYPRTFDLLILDEAHHVAPAAPKQVYAVDSQQTKLIRRLAPHFTHRLFLSATPHNGYAASFTALLEILDDQRFARGAVADRKVVNDVVVRRLKRQFPQFPRRETKELFITYPDSEREVHALLDKFAAARRVRLKQTKGRKAADLVTLLLKKRLFSSPYAFARTIATYSDTLRSKGTRVLDPEDSWLDEFMGDAATLDDKALDEAETDALSRTVGLIDTDEDELALLTRMKHWADGHIAQPDTKAHKLIEELKAYCKPDAHWLNNRIIVFTEYRDTKNWLRDLLADEGLGAPYVAELDGSMDNAKREELRLAFQKSPRDHKVRILLATDAASEGIDLQNHCHRLINYDIPFNPNKLEQRIGRIDRYGQTEPPLIQHFVGTGFDRAVDPYEADLEFLSRVAWKVSRMEEDLGSVNAVLAEAIQKRLTGGGDFDIEHVAPTAGGGELPPEQNVDEQLRKLRRNLDETIEELRITPGAVKRVVDTALDLARQLPLTEANDPDEIYDVPDLTGTWQRATAKLFEKLPAPGKAPRRLRVSFDQAVAKRRDDVVLAHLGHPLVAMSTHLLRTAVSNSEINLHRVAAVVHDDPKLEGVLVAAFSRFVLVGGDGVRLHEEVLHSGGWLPQAGRFRRWENVQDFGAVLDRAFTGGSAATPRVQQLILDRWNSTNAADGLEGAINWRTRDKQQQLLRKLAQRQEAEEKRIVANLTQFDASLRRQLDDGEDALFSRAELERDREELKQYERDRDNWKLRLEQLPAERDRELEQIAARYRDPQVHVFPVAVIFVVPSREVQ